MRRDRATRLPEGRPSPTNRVTAVLGVAAATLAVLGAATIAAGSAVADTSPTAHNPRSHGVTFTATPTGIRAYGWASDPDSIATNLTVTAVQDGTRTIASTVTSIRNVGVQQTQGTGPTAVYSLTFPVSTGKHTVCIVGRNVGQGTDSVLGCVATPLGTRLSAGQVAAHSPLGAVTAYSASASKVRFTGWTSDPDYLNRPLLAVLYLDGAPAATVTTVPFGSQTARPSAAGANSKFDISVPVGSGTHVGCIWAVNVGLGSNSFLGCDAVDTRGPAGTAPVTQPAVNKAVYAEAIKHKGSAYVWGATGPKVFDCSGLVVYSYGKQKMTLPRVSSAQALAARLIPASRAVPGDLVFYHDQEGDVYHVGIYSSPGVDFAAIDEQEGVNYQTIWDPSSVTYGSFTHT